ncbi:Tumor necrosis factor receptor superfamily member 22 [Pteropus alecto]|uniref:Tumor necrosis factor receptor superfamily member 22 n=1 Tax=Pteropus alecto TaxID=9402 RepID=L5KPT6_PTEAL|nr:Tumor necrosis factor receptor superfamily member 22 [Pteropus alecto]
MRGGPGQRLRLGPSPQSPARDGAQAGALLPALRGEGAVRDTLPSPPPSLQATVTTLTVAASTDSVSQQSQVPPSGRRCRPDEYWTGSSCCKRCPTEEEVVRNCTVTSDQMCQCQTSHFYRPPDSPEECRPCSINSVLPEDTVEMVCEAPTLTTAPESPAGVNGFPNGCHGERRRGPGLVTTA